MRTTQTRLSTRAAAVAVAVVATVVVAGCSSGSDGDAASSSSGSADGQPFQVARAAPAGGVALDVAPSAADAPGSRDGVSGTRRPPVLTEEALIKVAAVTLKADDVGAVIDGVDVVVASVGGEVASEDTSTNRRGAEVSSRLEVKVPVADFDAAVRKISKLGALVAKSRSSEDVTARVADVTSRVRSAQLSIAQLRTLFQRATKLSDVISLERELSDREADLEALQEQQRTLSARTTMSTNTVNVSRPPREATTTPGSDDRSGFISGLKSGWHGLVTFVLAAAHTAGLVLPLGALALLVALLAFFGLRRFMPAGTTSMRPPAASE